MFTIFHVTYQERIREGLRAEGRPFLVVSTRNEALTTLQRLARENGVGEPSDIMSSIEDWDDGRYYVWPRW